jgi:hypothetical protein
MRPRCCVWTLLCLASAPASAQAPSNVNDCTLLPDPVALRRCVDSFGPQNQRSFVPPPSSPPAAIDEATPSEPVRRAAPMPRTPQSSGDWLHENVPATKPDRSDPNAIRLDD